MRDLMILGASGFGREVAWLAERINAVRPMWHIAGFLDDREDIWGTSIGGYPVLGGCSEAIQYPDAHYVCAIGAGKVRRSVVERLETLLGEPRYATLIDPSVILSDRVEIGAGSVICAGCILTVDIRIGRHVIVNLDCTVGHDAIVHDFVTFYPSVNLSGMTEIAECVELGTGAQIIQGKAIGAETIVGAGAVVVKDLPDRCTAVGIPATPIKYHN